MSKFDRAGFLVFVLFASHDLELAGGLRLLHPQKVFPISMKIGM